MAGEEVPRGGSEGGDEVWVSAAEVEARIASRPTPDVDPAGVFGCGVVVDCLARSAVLAMPYEVREILGGRNRHNP